MGILKATQHSQGGAAFRSYYVFKMIKIFLQSTHKFTTLEYNDRVFCSQSKIRIHKKLVEEI